MNKRIFVARIARLTDEGGKKDPTREWQHFDLFGDGCARSTIYKSVKWVSEIRFDATESTGYWEQRGYDADAWIGRSNGLG